MSEPVKCPYCGTTFGPGEGLVGCPHCQTPHHQECWQQNNGCTTLGCPSNPESQRKSTAAPASFRYPTEKSPAWPPQKALALSRTRQHRSGLLATVRLLVVILVLAGGVGGMALLASVLNAPPSYLPEPGAPLVDLSAVALGSVVTTPDGAISLKLPPGWVISERKLGGWLISAPGLQAALLTSDMLLPALPSASGPLSLRDALAFYAAHSRTTITYGDPVALNAGGRVALRAPATNTAGGVFIYAQGDGAFVFVFVLETQRDLLAVQAPLLAIAATVTSND